MKFPIYLSLKIKLGGKSKMFVMQMTSSWTKILHTDVKWCRDFKYKYYQKHNIMVEYI